ncbi:MULTISPECIES: hypothetical protein [unclassified Mesorhizobium]|uniref:hypothetical protein n=1 Tax=unclassified Mesorhizobium TaxID=325217 RepID=UPI0011292199|nr:MULTISPECIES: hypothetical protein [unclassified Mesorhizobium]TPK95662.1 hypothetical protein FJ567_22530 [Mesorhizobium sp. B2-4-16]TPL67220.1 hypothetical protein FJ956_19425 [Mesorhizobium sp. B2-4-3]
MIQSAIDNFAPGFEIDTEFSQEAADDRMARSFDLCWDRVHKGAWTEEDEEAVLEHGCVIYVLGPHMDAEGAVETSATALRLIVYALNNGAIAAKGESAGVAHGAARWKQLGQNVEHAKEDATLARLCRLAFSRRPLSDGEFLCSVGFHLIGLPEVFVPRSRTDDELMLSYIIDSVADEMFAEGVEEILARYGAVLLPVDDYDEDDFKYNPYGAIYLRSDNRLVPQSINS